MEEMNKDIVCQRINAVMNTLDNGIEVRGVQNAGNLAGCYAILQSVLDYIISVDFADKKQSE